MAVLIGRRSGNRVGDVEKVGKELAEEMFFNLTDIDDNGIRLRDNSEDHL